MNLRQARADRALTNNRVRNAYFSDSTWEDRFEELIKYTQRTSTIIELTGTDATPSRMKSYVRERLAAFGIAPNLPRGNPPSYQSKCLLKTEDDRLDAAYLVALHYGPRGPGDVSDAEADRGQALDKRLEVYGRYCADLYPCQSARQQPPRLSFEDYVVLIDGIRAKAIAMHTCRDCRGSHPYSILQGNLPACPFCSRMKLDMGKARAELERRMQSHRSARLQPQAERLAAGPRSEQSQGAGALHDGRAVGRMQLVHQVGQVEADRAIGTAQALAGLPDRQAMGQGLQDFHLARRDLVA